MHSNPHLTTLVNLTISGFLSHTEYDFCSGQSFPLTSSISKFHTILARINRISVYAKLPTLSALDQPHFRIQNSLLANAVPRTQRERVKSESVITSVPLVAQKALGHKGVRVLEVLR